MHVPQFQPSGHLITWARRHYISISSVGAPLSGALLLGLTPLMKRRHLSSGPSQGWNRPQKLDHELWCIMEQITKFILSRSNGKKRHRHTRTFKSYMAPAALECTKAVSHLPTKLDLHAKPTRTRKRHLPTTEPSTKLSAWPSPASPTPTTARVPSPTSLPSA